MWQHLAAMSKDERAGLLVSLTQTLIQKDFYVAVAKELISIIPDWFNERKIPMKHVRKGISKRGSMTRAYSAGKQRIAKNMYDDCHVEGFTNEYSIDEPDCFMLAGHLIDAINVVCSGPLKTTKYLQRLAEYALAQGSKDLRWTSPSGFPIIYSAHLQRELKQRGTIKGLPNSKDGRVMHVLRHDVLAKDGSGKVPCRKSFASGISPNYVHSLDAAHMANVINNFSGSFAAVHDSFATHARDVPLLKRVTKEQFVKQYDVENFFEHIRNNIVGCAGSEKSVKAPEQGNLNIKEVMDSEYFFC